MTGHRHLDPNGVARIRAAITSILSRIRECVAEAAGDSEYRLVMISPLAEGTDQLAAEAALELGYEIQCAFPFPIREYRQDFAEGSEAERRFDALSELATAVLELDGRRPTTKRPHTPSSPEHGYEQVGRVVLENSDVLMAVWDGEEARGRGGTAQIVEEAGHAEIPTVVVPPDAPDEAHLLAISPGGSPRQHDLTAIEPRVREIVRPEETRPAGGNTGSDPDIAEHMDAQRSLYAMYRGEGGRVTGHRWALARAWTRFWSHIPFGIGGPGLKRRPAQSELPAHPPDTSNRDSRQSPSRLASWYAGHYEWSSALATHYGKLYRASFVANYLLGALAVALGLLAGIAHLAHEGFTDTCPLPLLGGAEHPGEASRPAATGSQESLEASHASWGTTARWLAVTEALIILLILFVADRARRGQWHRKAVDYRMLTEHLRTMVYLAPLGVGAPFTRPRPYVSDEGDLRTLWSNWEFRRVVRAAGLVDARFSEEYRLAARDLLARWVDEQVRYHHTTATSAERAHHRHERGALLCVLGALVACLLHLWPALDGCSFLLTAAAAGLPALAAALHGIAGQAELERISKRSEAMSRWLRSESNRGRLGAGAVGRGRSSLAGTDPSVPSGATLQLAARTIAAQMLDEVRDWQVLHRAGDVKAT